MSPIKFSDIYNLMFQAFETIENLFFYLTMPIEDLIDTALAGEILGGNFFGDIITWIIDNILDGLFGDFSLLELIFGSGLAFILVLVVIKFFLGVARG